MKEERMITREEALEELARYGIEGGEIYLIDFIPLIEMVWADGIVQQGEIAVLYEYIDRHVTHINTLAGYEALSLEQAHVFINRFLDTRPDPELLSTLRSFIKPIRLSGSDVVTTALVRDSLLGACLDIGASSVTAYPYGICDRFNQEEKQCFFEILESLHKKH